MSASTVKMKNLEAQKVCHPGCRFPVSRFAVLPMSSMAPIMPMMSGTSGRYFYILKTCYLLIDLRQKWLVSQPRMMSIDPDMVAMRKKTNYGKWAAQSLIQHLGKGGSWPYHWDWKQMSGRVKRITAEQVLKNMDGENSPINIKVIMMIICR